MLKDFTIANLLDLNTKQSQRIYLKEKHIHGKYYRRSEISF